MAESIVHRGICEDLLFNVRNLEDPCPPRYETDDVWVHPPPEWYFVGEEVADDYSDAEGDVDRVYMMQGARTIYRICSPRW